MIGALLRRIGAAAIAALLACAAHAQLGIGGPILGGANAPAGLRSAAAVAITGGSITGVSGVRQSIFSSGLPLIIAPTGTMANNGAVTLGTALDATYSDALILLPAGAIAAGVPAATTIYYVQMSSTTVGTVFNNIYTTGSPSIPSSPTAFATTGPGAFTGVTVAVDTFVVSIPGGSLGTNGYIAYEFNTDSTNSVNGKTIAARLATTDFAAHVGVSALSYHGAGMIQNRGAAGKQVGSTQATTGGWGPAGAVNTFRGTVDTTTAQNFVLRVTRSTATEYLIIASLAVDLVNRP